MRAVAAFPMLLAAMAAGAQSPGDMPPPVSFPPVARQAATIEGFVPTGWLLNAKAEGDLNRDGLPDAALVVQMNDPRNLVSSEWDPEDRYNSNPRMLVLAFARKEGGFELAAKDHALIPRLENQNQDDPFDEVSIRNGALQIKMHLFMDAGGWEMGGSAFTFRWQDGGFKLIGFDGDEVHRGSGETTEVSINYLTGRKLLKTGNIGDDKQRSQTLTVPKKPLLDLTEIGDGLMFDPDER